MQEQGGPVAFRRRILVIYNPTAGMLSRRRLRRVLAHVARLGAEATVRVTRARGDAEAFARRASAERFDVVAAAGGDGTLNEVANGVAGTDVPLAVIPLGTANVLAAEIGMPMTSRGIARTLVFGPQKRVNVGLINGRRFLMMAGVGFDAHVVARVSPRVKRLLGRMTYVFELLQGLFRFPYRRYRVTIDGQTWDAASVVIANGHFYGGRFTVAPQARLDDPHLDVCLFLGSGAWNVVRYGVALLFGRLDRLGDVRVVRGSEIVIEGTAGEPVQCDGDVVARLPLVARPSGLDQLLVLGG